MKVIEFEKNSEAWREYRNGKSGGSEFKDLYVKSLPTIAAMKAKLDDLLIDYPKSAKAPELAELLTPETLTELKLAADRKKLYYELIAERVARPITPNDYVDRLNGQPFSMMLRGHLLEPEALATFAEATGKHLHAACAVWERDDNPNIYISPDGVVVDMLDLETDITLITPTEAVEVKCLGNAETIKAFLTGSYPKEYWPQILKYFVVNDKLEKLYFVLYTDMIPGLELQIFEITRDDIAEGITDASTFENAVMHLIDRDAARIAELAF